MSKAKWATGTAVLACTGLLGAYAFIGSAGAATGPAAAPSKKVAAAAVSSKAEAAAPTAKQTTTKQTTAKPATSKRAAAKRPAVLSGKREVTIVRVQAFEGGLSLDGGELTEVDDDSGRQLFVPTPIKGSKYLIKAYGTPNDHPANDEPACWQVYNPGSVSLTVEGAVCDAKNPAQQFEITATGKKAYAISNRSAFLQYFPNSGLILEEVGDATLETTFRFNDNGPARTPAGG